VEAREFTQAEKVQEIVNGLKEDRAEGRLPGGAPHAVSDVVDDEGLQYVDLVMEGGGVLGVALVGYTYVLEEMGIRFLRVGGTSAGSINAALVAGLGPPADRKSGKIIEQLANLDFWEFVDGDEDARDFVRTLVRSPGRFKLGLKGLQVLDSMFSQLALNPGNTFYEWLSKLLEEEGVDTTKTLRQRMATLPKGLKLRGGEVLDEAGANPYLALVAADISTQTKVAFPEMAPLYWGDSANVDPALYVRASMSIPFFFEPLRVSPVPQGEAARQRWDELASYTGDPPEIATFVDGGIMSNFPIDLFHQPQKVPSAPTFGAKLGADERSSGTIATLSELALAVFRSASHTLDYDFIKRNPDYRKLVSYIDTGDHSWLAFDMSEKDKVELFTCGVRKAAEFLRGFDWKKYKELRELKQALYT
jgi:NTE family protein